MTYAEQLKDPRWQRRRLEVLNQANFECTCCGNKEKTLHVHHKIYRKGHKVWEYPDAELEVLCEDCHLNETLLRRQLDEAVARLTGGDLEMLVGFAEAMVAVDCVFGDEVGPEQEWPLRSCEHAWGFLARLASRFPPEVLYKFIDLKPLKNADVFHVSVHGLDGACERRAQP